MSKAADTYWINSQTVWPKRNKPANLKKGRDSIAKAKTNLLPKWVPVVVVVTLTVMICLTINFRAFSVMNKEVKQNSALQAQIQSKTDENLALQEEIHYLKSDSSTIEREARKFGLTRAKDKVPVPTK